MRFVLGENSSHSLFLAAFVPEVLVETQAVPQGNVRCGGVCPLWPQARALPMRAAKSVCALMLSPLQQ